MAAPSHFSSPPAWAGLSPSSLRGEAVAYLVSGLRRVGAVPGCAGAVWLADDGAIDSAPGLFKCPVTASPSLDAHRAGLLRFLRSVRAPAAPAVPSGAAPVAFMESGEVDWPARSHQSVAPAPVALEPPAPAWGRAHRVAGSAREAAEGGWLAVDGSARPGRPHAPFVATSEFPDQSALTGLALFMASASEPQRTDGPDASMAFALPDPPPGARPPGLSASAVSGMFRADDPSAMTRCWVRGASFALDPSRASSFTYWAAAGCDASAVTAEQRLAALEDFREEFSGESFYWDSSDPGPGGVMYIVGEDDAFSAWWDSSGPVSRRHRWGLVRVESGGACWADLDATWAEDDYGEGASPSPSPWLEATALETLLPTPDNTEHDYDAPPYWRTVAAPHAPFEVAYAGGAPSGSAGPAALPAVPREGTPLSGAPVASPDDVAVQLAFTARVTLVERIVGDVASCGGAPPSADPASGWDPDCSDDGAVGRGARGLVRTRTWVVSGPVPGCGRWTRAAGAASGSFDGGSGLLFASPGDMRDFVESAVLPAVGVDPHGLLAGSAYHSRVPDPCGHASIDVYREEPGADPVRTRSIPWRVSAYSGDLVEEALLRVDVDLAAGCVFESGYCA